MALSILPAALQPGIALNSAPQAVLTAPGTTTLVLKRAVFSNVSGSPTSFQVSVLRSGSGSPQPIIVNCNLDANGTSVAPELANLVLASGDTLQASCQTGGGVLCVISGFTLV